MRFLFTKRRLAFLSVIVLMVFLAGMLQPSIQSRRTLEMISFAPPGELKHIVLFTQAFGAFRGLIIDALWLRAEYLKQEGKFFELAQLYELICAFEPHFTEIWIHHAWNMAYNISVELPSARERWSWVNKGIRLLRDEAIRYNPREAELYKELAWIYLHKIGDNLDNKHFYYKRMMVLTHHRLFGANPDLQGIADAPYEETKLLQDEAVAAIVAKLNENGIDPFTADLMPPDLFPAGIYKYKTTGEAEKLAKKISNSLLREYMFGEKGFEVLSEEKDKDAVKKLLDHVVKKYLLNELKLDPAKMLALEKKYGYLDWRMPEVHGLYWAEESVRVLMEEKQREGEQKDETGEYVPGKNPLFFGRYVYTAFRLMFRRGRARIIVRYGGSDFDIKENLSIQAVTDFSPDIQWVDELNEIYIALIEMLDGTNKFSVENARKNWLRRAVYYLYTYGKKQAARHYYGEYITAMRKSYSDFSPPEFEIFVMRMAKENLSSQGIDMTLGNVKGHILNSIIAEEIGDVYEAANYLNLSKLIYDNYVKENKWISNPERFKAPLPFNEMYREVLKMYREQLPPEGRTKEETEKEDNNTE